MASITKTGNGKTPGTVVEAFPLCGRSVGTTAVRAVQIYRRIIDGLDSW